MFSASESKPRTLGTVNTLMFLESHLTSAFFYLNPADHPMDLIFPGIKWANNIYLPGLWIEMSAVKDLSEVINEEDFSVCHKVHHLCEDIAWRSSWAAEISDTVIYTDNWVDRRQKAPVERHCGSMGHVLCGTKGGGGWDAVVGTAPLSSTSTRIWEKAWCRAGHATGKQTRSLCWRTSHSPISTPLNQHEKCLHRRVSGQAATQAP